MKELSKKELESLVEIARKHIYPVEARGDLETRDNDSRIFWMFPSGASRQH